MTDNSIKPEMQFYDNSNVDVNNFQQNDISNNGNPEDHEQEDNFSHSNHNDPINNQFSTNSQDNDPQSCDENGNPMSQDGKRNTGSMEPEQFRKVFIGGLSYKTDDETLKTYFEKYGDLVDHVVMKDGQTGRSRGFGFVTYSDSFMVDELMKNRPHIIDGRQVEPKRATPREDSGKAEVQMTVKKLFIGGLRDNISDEDLMSYFGVYGSVAEAIVMKEKDTGKSRGFGFVTFDDYDPVDKIILQKIHTINGVNVHTQKALPKDGGQDGGGGRQQGGSYQGNFNNNGSGNRPGNNRGRQNNSYGNDGNYLNSGGGGGGGGGHFNNNHNGGGFSNSGGFNRGNNMGISGGDNGMSRFGNNDNGFNSSMNNTYGSYNQAPSQPKMNSSMPMMGSNGGGYMGGGGNRNNNGGPGPMRRGGGGFSNRSAGPYGGISNGGFQGHNNGGGRGGFQGSNNSRGGFNPGSRGRGGIVGRGGGGGGGFNRGGNQQQ